MERDEEKCFICDRTIDRQEQSPKVVTCKQVAMARLRRSSLRRKDKKYVFLKNRDSVDLHKGCYSKYINEDRIMVAKNHLRLGRGGVGKAEKGKANNSSPQKAVPKAKPTPVPRRKNEEPVAELENFDFMKHCLYCGKRAKKNQRVQWVQKEQTKTYIINKIAREKSSCDYLKAIEDRIKNVDLVAVAARYHHHCKLGFSSYNSSSSHVIGRPIGKTTIDMMNFIKNHMDANAEERQFSLKGLIDKYKNSHENEDEPCRNLQNFKDRLLPFLGEAISIDEIKGDYILTLVEPVDVSLESNS